MNLVGMNLIREVKRMRANLLTDIRETHKFYPKWKEFFRPIYARGNTTIIGSRIDKPQLRCPVGYKVIGMLHTHPKTDTISISPADIDFHVLGNGLMIRYIGVLNTHPRTGIPWCMVWEFRTAEEAFRAGSILDDCYGLAEHKREITSSETAISVVYDNCAQRRVKPIFKVRLD